MNNLSDKPIVNRVAKSNIVTIHLEDFIPSKEIVSMDLKGYLFREMILREKDFRESIEQYEWANLQDQILWIYCSADAIIPLWAYMLISSKAGGIARDIYYGDEMGLNTYLILNEIQNLDVSPYAQKPIIIKGCGSKPIDAMAYIAITKKLKNVAKSILFGEPCSTVPIYKSKK